MIVFVQGVPSKRDYRRFRIKTVSGADDYASMAEVLRRRFGRAKSQDAQRSLDGKENRWAIMPDLLVVDGGKGQLGAARKVMEEMGVGHIPAVGLAKEQEALYVPGRSDPILLPQSSQGLYVLQRLRDEAHRFAITYHRRLRAKESIRSRLEDVPGIGPKRRRALLAKFGSVAAIKEASVDDVAAVHGMNRTLAQQLSEFL